MHIPAAKNRKRSKAYAFAACAVLFLLMGCHDKPRDQTPSTAPLQHHISAETTLRIGDIETQNALALQNQPLPYRVEWLQAQGGPLSIEAFRSGTLDASVVGDIPPLLANAIGLPVRIIASKRQLKPDYVLASAPGITLTSLADLKGKRIAYSPGQAQGAFVLRSLKKAGLTKNDVTLVELQSVDDAYSLALAANQIDVAPLQTTTLLSRYLHDYQRDGAMTLTPDVDDGVRYLYASVEALNDPAKAAALNDYAKRWAQSTRWIEHHPQEWITSYLIGERRVDPQQANDIMDALGTAQIYAQWTDVIAIQQRTIDLLVEAGEQRPLDAHQLFDFRYEHAAAEGLKEAGYEQ